LRLGPWLVSPVSLVLTGTRFSWRDPEAHIAALANTTRGRPRLAQFDTDTSCRWLVLPGAAAEALRSKTSSIRAPTTARGAPKDERRASELYERACEGGDDLVVIGTIDRG
jgi:hypothetical protein